MSEAPAAVATIGTTLARARESAGWTQEDVGHELKLPLATVVALERDDFAAAGAAVYVRGFVRSYARLMGFEEHAFDDPLHAHFQAAETPSLIPSHGMRRRINWGERYSWAFSYLVGTALVLTLIWTIIGFDSDTQRLAAEARQPRPEAVSEPRPSAVPPVSDVVFQAGQEAEAPVAAAEPSVLPGMDLSNPAPVMASMSPFSGAQSAPYRSTPTSETGVILELAGTSWVEIQDGQGQRIAFGMLSPGQHRFSGRPPLLVLLGNATGASLQIDGRAVDFQAFLRANVARFRVTESTDGLSAELALPR